MCCKTGRAEGDARNGDRRGTIVENRKEYGTKSIEQPRLHGAGRILYFRDIFIGALFRCSLAARSYGSAVCRTRSRGFTLSGALSGSGRTVCQSPFRMVVDYDVSLFGYGVRIADDSVNQWIQRLASFFFPAKEIEPVSFSFIGAMSVV